MRSNLSERDDDLSIRVDKSDNHIGTGETNTRTLVVEVPTLGSSREGRQAEFEYNPGTETYQLKEYQAVSNGISGWRQSTLKFRQEDVVVLNYLADHIRETSSDSVDVGVFVGEDMQ